VALVLSEEDQLQILDNGSPLPDPDWFISSAEPIVTVEPMTTFNEGAGGEIIQLKM
jgi:hypothetical protein